MRTFVLLLVASACDAELGSGPNEPADPPSDATPEETRDPNQAQNGNTPDGKPDFVSDIEWELYLLIEAYRAENLLPSVPLSPSLSTVARTHSTDLLNNGPHNVGDCNLHSWSSAGLWTACCYTPDHAQAQCMWDKPRELSSYPGNGYEISAWGPGTAAGHLDLWKSSPGHNDVILNKGGWADNPWGAVGVGIDGPFANVWWGREADPALE